MHPIRAYCRRHGLRLYQLAAQVGCPSPVLSRFVSGTRRPSSDMLVAIHRGTNGEVGVMDLVRWHWPELARAAEASRGDGLAEEAVA